MIIDLISQTNLSNIIKIQAALIKCTQAAKYFKFKSFRKFTKTPISLKKTFIGYA